jgi:hypothetical protein
MFLAVVMEHVRSSIIKLWVESSKKTLVPINSKLSYNTSEKGKCMNKFTINHNTVLDMRMKQSS